MKNKLLSNFEGDNDDSKRPTGIIGYRLIHVQMCIITMLMLMSVTIGFVALVALIDTLTDNKIHKEDSPTNACPLLITTNATDQGLKGLCLTAHCVQAAGRMLKYMDTSISPCDDFYKFSCGGWTEKSRIPEGLESWGTFDELAQSNYQYLINYLSGDSKSDSKAVMKAKQIFAMCTDTKQVEHDYPDAVRYFLMSTGGWNETNVTQSDTWSLNSNLIQEHYYGSSAFFSFDIDSDDLNSSKAVIKVF